MRNLPAFCLRTICLTIFALSLIQSPAASLADLLSQLQASAKSSGDATLKSLASDLSTKATKLDQSLTNNPAARSQLQSVIESLAGTNGVSTLESLNKLTAAKLTPDQMRLAKDIGNAGSAYLVQKNFSALEGSQSDVATIVNSLRKGQPAAALPPLQKVAQNATLTAPQKDLLSSLADKYAPGAKKLGSAIEGGLRSIPGFGK